MPFRRLSPAPPPDELKFVAVLDSAAKHWAQSAKPFHLVLQVAPGEEAALTKRMQSAGLKLEPLVV